MATANNLYIDQGVTYTIIIQVFSDDDGRVPLDLTGANVRSQMRKSYLSQSVTAEFNTSIVEPEVGKIRLSLSSAETANIRFGRYVYDTMVTTTDGTFKASEGIAVVYPSVTKG